jgi:hypothetical protein
MAPYVVSVRPLPDFRLELEFTSGEHRIFDVKPYLRSEVFGQLRDATVFATAHVVAGSVEWHGATPLSSPALSFDTLYIDSVPSGTCDSVSA